MTTPPKPPYREEDIKAVREANLPRLLGIASAVKAAMEKTNGVR
jgi:hypothetical protein